jgi:type I restriction-modification system DNA methylase subunit
MTTTTINEVRRRLQIFAKEHANDSDEKQHAQQFWRDFYMCFGLNKSSASMFEKRVLKVGGARGYIDSFIPSVLLVEQKSLGKDLDKAYEQARDYFYALENEFEKPQYIITCDFQTFKLYNLHSDTKEPQICKLDELHKRADWFMFLVDKRVVTVSEETPVNRKAAEQVSKLHEGLLRANYVGKDLESFLTRLLFCLFADDTGIFGDDGQFRRLIEKTKEDGSDVGSTIALLFQVLNTPKDKRQTNLDENLKAFEYVNGSLFAEYIQTPYFDFDLRTNLLRCVEIDWSGISPAIFGSMFQSVLEYGATDNHQRTDTRRELGAHYTSERNILKVIQPLFLDDLRNEYEQAKGNKTKLKALYDKLPTLKFFDPACGCGNFLVIAYKELRNIENDVINELYFKGERGLLDISTLCRVNVGQFYGIEIDEAATHIARVAMYITDHQLNLESANKFGQTRATVPLITTPHIHCANALIKDWNEVVDSRECNYIFGNPPFIGKQWQTAEQKSDLEAVASEIKNYGVLDYVCGWYIKAIEYIRDSSIKVAFVSTNSITQGEQVPVLWSWLINMGAKINFAHRTFKWNNEGRGVAAVHCVIIGFSKVSESKKYLFSYADIADAEPIKKLVSNINPYLVDAEFVLIQGRRQPICNVKNIAFGSMPNDGGNLLLNEFEKDALLKKYPSAASIVRKFIGGEEYINGINRYCLWLVDVEPNGIRAMTEIYERVLKVKETRSASTRLATRNLASTPMLFGEIRQPQSRYLAIPEVSSEKREYLPIGYVDSSVIASNKIYTMSGATNVDLAVLISSMHMSWMRTVCGRMKSDYQYSAGIVYNNFVWGRWSDAEQEKLSATAQAILDARNLFPNSTLADLYDPLTMPIELLKAHQANNKAVDEIYGFKGEADDASRVAFLFKKYEELTSILPSAPVKKKRIRKDYAQSDLI